MSHYENIIRWAAIGVVLAYAGFFLAFTEGFSISDHSALFMGVAVIGFLGAVALAVGLAAGLTQRRGGSDRADPPDEREAAIDQQAEQIGYRVLEVCALGLIGLALYESHAGAGALGSYSLTRSEGLIFALITAMTLAALARLLGAILLDRRA